MRSACSCAQDLSERAGTTIFSMMVLIWFCIVSAPPRGRDRAGINYSLAAMIGHALEPILARPAFNWQINVALIPVWRRARSGSPRSHRLRIEAAREAADQIAALANKWSLATRWRSWPGTSSRRSAPHAGRHPARDRRLAMDGGDLRLHAGAGLYRGLATYHVAVALGAG